MTKFHFSPPLDRFTQRYAVTQSVILLTRLPFINLYYEVLSIIAPKYFAGGESVLRNVCTDISNWPAIQAGECIQLSLLDTVFQTYVPSLTSANLQQTYITTNAQSADATTPDEETDEQSSSGEHCRFIEQTSGQSAGPAIGDRSADTDCPQTGDVQTKTLAKEDILESYKQSKEMLLAQPVTQQLSSNCDSRCTGEADISSSDIAANDNGVANDESEAFSDIKFSSKNADITQSGHSTKVERPLFTLRRTKKTPIALSSVNEIDIFRSLCSVLPYTHLLWELVLTAEPIVVMSTSPSDCSHMVQTLMR